MSYPFFQSFKKLNKKSAVEVCSWKFKLNRMIVTFYLVSATIISTKQFVGEPITCISHDGGSDSLRQLVSTYCLGVGGIYSLRCVAF